MSDKCTYFRSAYSNCPNDASLEVGGEPLCKDCASIEKGRLEVSQKAILRALKNIKSRLKVLNKVKSTQYDGRYRVVVKMDMEGLEDEI